MQQGKAEITQFEVAEAQHHPGSASIGVEFGERAEGDAAFHVVILLVRQRSQLPPALAPYGVLLKSPFQKGLGTGRLIGIDCLLDSGLNRHRWPGGSSTGLV